MNITVYLGARTGHRQMYIDETRKLGKWIGENGHSLVYGGGAAGLMGILADSVIESGGKVIGVIPEFMVLNGKQHPGLHEAVVTETMSTRRQKMAELGDVYIAMPGGVGTLDEISEMISDRGLGLHRNTCMFYNIGGYYEPMRMMLPSMTEAGFLPAETAEDILFPETSEQMFGILRSIEVKNDGIKE